MEFRSVCVFCGSSSGATGVYGETARKVGRLLAERGLTLIYGGGGVGLMGVVADACMEAGGAVIGVIPRALAEREVAHHGLTELHIVESMHERKAMMAELSDAFIAMPGGYGTFEEFCEIVTWSQLGIHTKPCGLLNIAGYYDPLLRQFDHGVAEQFIKPQHRRLVLSADCPEDMLKQLESFSAPLLEKLVGPDET